MHRVYSIICEHPVSYWTIAVLLIVQFAPLMSLQLVACCASVVESAVLHACLCAIILARIASAFRWPLLEAAAQSAMHLLACRSLLGLCQPSTLIIVGSNQALASNGINSATRAYHQVPLGRSFFDDTQVQSASPAACILHAS